MKITARKIFFPRSTWVHALILTCSNQLAVWYKNHHGIPTVCCLYPGVDGPGYFDLMKTRPHPGQFVWRVLPYKQPYVLVAPPTPPFGVCAGIAFIQAFADSGTYVAPYTFAYSLDVTAGNFLALALGTRPSGSGSSGPDPELTASVTDSLGQTWTQAGSYVRQVDDLSGPTHLLYMGLSIWYVPATLGGPCTVTIAVSAPGDAHVDLAVVLTEYSGVSATTPLHATSSNVGTTGGANTGTVTAAAGELVFAAALRVGFGGSNYGITAPFTLREDGAHMGSSIVEGVADLTDAGGDAAAQFTNPDQPWAAMGASFKKA
jgi:hypothetical protein